MQVEVLFFFSMPIQLLQHNLSSIELLLYSNKKPLDLFLGSLLFSTDLCFYPSAKSQPCDCCCYTVNVVIRYNDSSYFILVFQQSFKIYQVLCLSILILEYACLCFPPKIAGIFMGVVLNPQINLGLQIPFLGELFNCKSNFLDGYRIIQIVSVILVKFYYL